MLNWREGGSRSELAGTIGLEVIMETTRRSRGRNYFSSSMLALMIVACVMARGTLQAQTAGGSSSENAWMQAPPTSTGIAVGQKIPPFSLPDQNGKIQNFNSIKGANGAAVYFMRSADW